MTWPEEIHNVPTVWEMVLKLLSSLTHHIIFKQQRSFPDRDSWAEGRFPYRPRCRRHRRTGAGWWHSTRTWSSCGGRTCPQHSASPSRRLSCGRSNTRHCLLGSGETPSWASPGQKQGWLSLCVSILTEVRHWGRVFSSFTWVQEHLDAAAVLSHRDAAVLEHSSQF